MAPSALVVNYSQVKGKMLCYDNILEDFSSPVKIKYSCSDKSSDKVSSDCPCELFLRTQEILLMIPIGVQAARGSSGWQLAWSTNQINIFSRWHSTAKNHLLEEFGFIFFG
jgi:hypothetical protein